MRPATLVALGLLLASACECGGTPLNPLVPLLSPEATRVQLPDVYVGASREGTLRFHSNGTGLVTIHDVTLEDASAEGFSLTDTGEKSVNPGAALEVRVAYAPLAEGPATVVVVVDSDAENAPTRIVLEANALPPLDCGETTTCQRRTFLPETGECLVEDLEGPCDDGNACTEDDTCFEGTCVGAAITCPSPFSCAQGLCDATEGCVLLAHDDRCEDDGDPCTVERCDLEEGCVREDLLDGTPCGATPSCASASLCYGGVCTVFDVPNGTPCNDGDFCTVDDECHDGACGGVRVERAPAIAGEVRTFGTEGGRAVLLSESRILFLDPHTRDAYPSWSGDAPGGYVATVVEVDEGGMQILSQTDFPEERLPSRLVESSPGVVVALSQGDGVTLVQRFEIASDASVALALAVESATLSTGRAVALPDGRIVATGNTGRLWLLEPEGLSQTQLAEVPTPAAGAWAGPEGLVAFAGGVVVAMERQLLFVGLDGAVSPFGEELRLLQGLASDDGLLAAASCGDTFGATDCEVILFDAALAELNRIPVGHGLHRPLALDGGRLVVGRDGPAMAYDVSDPAAPLSLAQTLPWSATDTEEIAFRDGVGLFSQSRTSTSFAAPHVVVSLSEAGLDFIRHPRWGSPGALQAQGSGLMAASRTSVRHLDVNTAGAPLALAAAPLPRPVGSADRSTLSLIHASDGALMPVERGSYSHRTTVRAYEASVPALPPFPLRTLRLLASGSLAANRRLLVAFNPSGGPGNEVLLVFDLLSLPPEDDIDLVPRSETLLPWSIQNTDESFGLHVALDPDNQIAVLSPATTAAPFYTELLLFDASTPEAPVLVGRGDVRLGTPEQWRAGAIDLAIAGATVVVTERAAPAVHVLRRLADGSAVEVMRFDSDKTSVLHFDGRTLVLGGNRSRELAFWDVSGTTPIDLGTTALPDEAVDAEPFADTLVVSGQSSIVTLDPPCPPLP